MKKDRLSVEVESIPTNCLYGGHKVGFLLFAQLRPSANDTHGMAQSQHLLVKPTQRQLRRYKKAFMRKATTNYLIGV